AHQPPAAVAWPLRVAAVAATPGSRRAHPPSRLGRRRGLPRVLARRRGCATADRRHGLPHAPAHRRGRATAERHRGLQRAPACRRGWVIACLSRPPALLWREIKRSQSQRDEKEERERDKVV
ncbi:unnamed protein product, partial [Urochloa humidicola]